MREFFHGWRRKMGVVTLVIACVFMALWVRSLLIRDEIQFSIGDHTTAICETMKHAVGWSLEFYAEEDSPALAYWNSEAASERDMFDGQPFQWRKHCLGFGIGGNQNESPELYWLKGVTAPYWSIVLPLTLLSAYLLLSKPRPKLNQSDDAQNPKKISDPR